MEDDHIVAKILKDFFSNIITNLNLSLYIYPLINTENVEDTILKAKMRYVNHPGIKTITNQFPNNRFSFK